MRIRKPRSVLSTVTLAFASILVAMLLVEAGLQVLYRSRHGEWLWADRSYRIEYTQPVKNRRKYGLRPGYEDEEVGITINQLGFREVGAGEDANDAVSVCLGYGVPFGEDLRATETYPAILANSLSSSNPSLNVVNVGVPSYNLQQSFDRFQIDVTSRYASSPIALVTIDAAGDIALPTEYRADWTADVTWAELGVQRGWVAPPEHQNLATLHYLSIMVGRLHKKDRVSPNAHQELPGTEMLSNVLEVLAEELAFYQDQSIPVVLMPVNPFYYQLSNQEKNRQLMNWDQYRDHVENCDAIIRDYNTLLEEISLEFGNTFFFDTRQVMDGHNRDEMYVDFIHYSPKGNRVIAKALLDTLEDQMFSKTDNEKLYDRVAAYLEGKNGVALASREAYWSRDFSSVDSYLEAIEPYREDFGHMIAVPDECLAGTAPVLVSDTYLASIDGVEIHRWVLDVCDGGLTTYALVGIPSGVEGPFPLVVAFHGTAGTPARIMGLDGIDDYHHQFGLELARQDYMVFAPQLITQSEGNLNQMRNELDNRGLSVGERLVGIEIGQMISAIDYLVTLDYVDSERLATYGISLGGLMSFYLGALDTRLEVVVVSQYVEDRVGKLTGQNYPDAYWRFENADYVFIPSQLRYFTDVDLASLIVPRKLFIEVGSQDARLSGASQVASRVEEFYDLLGQPSESIQIGVETGGHEIFLTSSLEFMNHWLKP